MSNSQRHWQNIIKHNYKIIGGWETRVKVLKNRNFETWNFATFLGCHPQGRKWICLHFRDESFNSNIIGMKWNGNEGKIRGVYKYFERTAIWYRHESPTSFDTRNNPKNNINKHIKRLCLGPVWHLAIEMVRLRLSNSEYDCYTYRFLDCRLTLARIVRIDSSWSTRCSTARRNRRYFRPPATTTWA